MIFIIKAEYLKYRINMETKNVQVKGFPDYTMTGSFLKILMDRDFKFHKIEVKK